MPLVIDIQQLEKSYGATRALKKVAFSVEQGELFGLIGPDGAGKTSLMRILTTLLLPDAGHARVMGLDVVTDYRQLRQRVGYMPGRFSLYEDLSVKENITLFATIFGTTLEANYAWVKDIYQQIEPFADRKAGALSGGMKQKLALSCALIHQPEVLFLDEPTTGVDAVSRREFWAMLKQLKAHGVSMLVSTPYMDEASLCDRVALIDQGEILGIDTPEGLVNGFGQPLYAIRAAHSSQKYPLLKFLRAHRRSGSVFAFGDALHYTDVRGTVSVEEMQQSLEAEGFEGVVVEPISPTVEDCFMAFMQPPTPSTS